MDRDGTVVREPEDARVDTVDKIQLFPDTIQAFTYLARNDFAVVFITNQAGIAEGRITEEEFWSIHNEVLARLAPSGITVLKTYVNGEADGPNATQWRKPGPNMLLQAAKDLGLNLAEVYMIGDKETDIQAATNAGCKGGILVSAGHTNAVEPSGVAYTAPHLMDAVRYIVANA